MDAASASFFIIRSPNSPRTLALQAEITSTLSWFNRVGCYPGVTAKLFRTALKLGKVLQTGLVSKLAGLFERFYSLRAARKFLRPLERLFRFDRQFGLHGWIAGFAQVSSLIRLAEAHGSWHKDEPQLGTSLNCLVVITGRGGSSNGCLREQKALSPSEPARTQRQPT